ncbi:MAG: DHH family phosphoesterase [Nitrososphaerota archaeon]|nr:DHH family phosphoesterase [Nitrososphaerota archaeon]
MSRPTGSRLRGRGRRSAKTFCMSHSRDVDGLSSAALAVAATGGDFLLTDYDTLVPDLGRVPKGIDRLVLCDMGVDGSDEGPFVEALGRIASRAAVTYVDHHFLGRRAKRRIEGLGVELVHDESECASMLAYARFKGDLPAVAWQVPLLGAVTDGMDDSPMARRLIEGTDRLHVLAEASLLSNAVLANRGARPFLRTVVRGLSRMAEPHEIKGVEASALRQLRTSRELVRLIGERGRKLRGLAYVVVPEGTSGNVAELIPGAMGAPVGVSLAPAGGRYLVELRGTSSCKAHLGKAISEVAARYGGSGGGHRLAAGGLLPVSSAEDSLKALDGYL